MGLQDVSDTTVEEGELGLPKTEADLEQDLQKFRLGTWANLKG